MTGYRAETPLALPAGYRIVWYLGRQGRQLAWVHPAYENSVFWDPGWTSLDDVVRHVLRWDERPGRPSSDHWDVRCNLADLTDRGFREKVLEFL